MLKPHIKLKSNGFATVRPSRVSKDFNFIVISQAELKSIGLSQAIKLELASKVKDLRTTCRKKYPNLCAGKVRRLKEFKAAYLVEEV